MAVQLADYVKSLKREVQPPGSEVFADVLNSEWTGYLADAFWEARLDGLLVGYTMEGEDTGAYTIVPTATGGSDIERQGIALIILYAGVKVLRNRILNMNTKFRAKAGPVEFEQENSATMLVEMLKTLKATKDRVIEDLEAYGQTGVMVLDAYSVRVLSPSSYGGGRELTG